MTEAPVLPTKRDKPSRHSETVMVGIEVDFSVDGRQHAWAVAVLPEGRRDTACKRD